MSKQQTLVVVDADEKLERILEELAALRRDLAAVTLEAKSQWMTVAEYAKQCGKTERTVRNWINEGQLKTKRHGRSVLIFNGG